jgi:hypothetical protein
MRAVSPASRVADAIAPRRPAAALDPAASTAAGKINNRAGQPAGNQRRSTPYPVRSRQIEMITMIFLGYRRPRQPREERIHEKPMNNQPTRTGYVRVL